MLIRLALAALALACALPAHAQSVQVVQDCAGVTAPTGPGGRLYTDQSGRLCMASSPAGITRSRLTCTLPAYTAGGNIVCTNEAG